MLTPWPVSRLATMTHRSRYEGTTRHYTASMPEQSLTIVLPAFNEEARLGPALDELFGYLHRRGNVARDGHLGSGSLPQDVQVLVVDDGSTDRTAALVRTRPEAAGGELELADGSARGQGCGRAGRDARWARRPDRVF